MAFLIPENLKSRKDVSAPIRRLAKALQVGLDDNVTVWFEPLYDPSGEKPHFVVLLPEDGIVVFEALDAKVSKMLGVFRGQVRIERDGQEVILDSPLVRAKKLAKLLQDRIGAETRLKNVKVPVVACAVFAGLTRADARKNRLDKLIDLSGSIFQDDIQAAERGEGETRLLRVFQKLKGFGHIFIEEKYEPILRGLIQPDIVLDRADKKDSSNQLQIFPVPNDSGEDVVRVMDRRQESMAKRLGDGHRVIRGVAGSGKTVILIARAKRLSQVYPKRRFLFLAYNRSLVGHLRTVLDECPNVEVSTIDRMMAQVIRAANLRFPGYDGPEDEVAEMALDALGHGKTPTYHGIFLDEAQDLSTTRLKFAVGLLKEGFDDLVVVADAAQNIYRRKFSWKKAGIQAQGRTSILRVNYRNTREILEFASRFLLASKELSTDAVPDWEDEMTIIPPEAASRNGLEPSLIECDNFDSEINSIVGEVKKLRTEVSSGKHQVAILYSSAKHGEWDHISQLNASLLDQGVDVFWANDPSQKRAKDDIGKDNSSVILLTIHSAKGLEFPNVITCGLWREAFRGVPPAVNYETNRKIAYVGFTRATESLKVITLNSNPMIADLRHALDLPDKPNLKAKVGNVEIVEPANTVGDGINKLTPNLNDNDISSALSDALEIVEENDLFLDKPTGKSQTESHKVVDLDLFNETISKAGSRERVNHAEAFTVEPGPSRKVVSIDLDAITALAAEDLSDE